LSQAIRIRPAGPSDVPQIYAFIVELAEYERSADQVFGTPELLAESLFGPQPAAEALIAELEGAAAGMAVFYRTFSTWECRPGIWLEDLYVPVARRRSGVGAALLSELARITVERGCVRLEWVALNWNAPALDFYEKLGAGRLEEWNVHRLEGQALTRVAEGPVAR
jgi:GNAT superfamily N-acetyltransferase